MNSDWLNNNMRLLDYILVNESDDNGIYADQHMTDLIGKVKDYNNKIVKVVAFHEEDSKKVLIEYKQVLAGWIELQDSIPLFNKPNEKIEVDYEKFYSPAINKVINKNGDYNLYFQRYQVFSRYYAFYDDELLEAIFRKNTFVAFAPSHVLDRMCFVDSTTKLKQQNIDIYATSKLDELIAEQLDLSQEVHVQAVFPNLKRAKIRQNEITGWVSTEALEDINLSQEYRHNLDEHFIIQQHNEYKYIDEQAKVKMILSKLLNENINLEKKLKKQRDISRRVLNRYANLRNSKLGKMQLFIWNKRSKRGNK
ncbi:hypothetical protein KYI09_03685 [Macrococcoides caseolyticum]|uniref:hypothetical protein n=1 Tax=Macrococcoides caseolyticum TaxID=69966 RepID=UPI001C6035AD|nr:hypothetical protein [Macrococcus caseolyticus]QYA40728.1 hypothetical protein KYI09_03685 [Macrococcus caseolyticus]